MKLNFPKNKWFIAFLIAAVVALAAIVVAAVVGVVANLPGNSDEGPEVGVYYYDLEDGEILLTLSAGNKFTIAGPGMNKTGTYTAGEEENTLVFDYFKDEDGTSVAVLNGDVLELAYTETKTLKFLKKVYYTVEFNVNGGEAIAPVKVLNGKAVAQPADPVKAGSVFLGWYADEALTQPYAFATTPIKAEGAVVYAKWAAKTTGVAEYTVSFDLGYEGATLESATTISGKLTEIATPEREGYTFGGWWISMTDNGEKLSYSYTDNTVFTADTTLFAVWYDNAATGLKAPAVNVGNSIISWNAVENATSYILTVVAPDGTAVINGESIPATSKSVPFADYAAGEYTITVVAVANDEADNATTVRYYTNKMLDKVTGIQVVNGILVFGSVENAERYFISIDCGNDKHIHNAADNGNSTTYYIGNCPMQEGGIKITVTAWANGYAASTSKTFIYDLTLDKVAKVEYDADKDVFVWDAVTGAFEYIVTVTVGENTVVINNGNSTSFSAKGYTGNVTVSVVPAATGYNSPEGTEASCEKTAPAAPTGLAFADGILTWAEAVGAVKYEVKVGNKTFTVETNSIDVVEKLNLAENAVYSVQVRSVSAANEASAYSDAYAFGYLAMSDSVVYNKNVVSWAPVLGNNITYKVRVNGKNVATVSTNYARIELTKEGENLIEVVCLVDSQEASDWMSVTVNAYAVEYDTRSPFGSFYTEYLAVGDEYTLPGTDFGTGFAKSGYNFAVWANSPMGNESNGAIITAGETFQGNTHTILYATWTAKEYKITLYVNGAVYGEATVTYNQLYTLPIPTASNSAYQFAGWYQQHNGEGRQYTDGTGASFEVYDHARDYELHAYFNSDALSFRPLSDGTYAVSSGPSIHAYSEITIPATHNDKPVSEIETSAFSSAKITKLYIPDTIRYIHSKAFKHAANLEYVEVYDAYPDDDNAEPPIYSSANGALLKTEMGITYLETVPKAVGAVFEVPAEVDEILAGAFWYGKVVTVIIPANVKVVPEGAFSGCTYLKNVIIQGNRTENIELSVDAFGENGNIESFEFPAALDYDLDTLKILLGRFQFLKHVSFEDGNKNFSSVNGMVLNKDKDAILYCPRAYAGDKGDGVLEIPAGIYKIGDNAFSNRTGIKSVTIPIWVSEIGNQAFYSASTLETVVFEGGRLETLSVGTNAFGGCGSLTTVIFQGNGGTALDSRITLGSSVFAGSASTKLTTVTIGEGVNLASIPSDAFKNQTKLTTVSINDNAYVGSIAGGAFNGCSSLTAFRVPAAVSSIASYAFQDCFALADLTFAPDAEGADPVAISISNYAFMNCKRLLSVTLPDRLGSFNSAAFEGCSALKSITVNTTNSNYVDVNGVLYKKNSTGGYDALLFYPAGLIAEKNGIIDGLPETLTKIGGSAFSNSNGLIKISIPKGVTSIDANAFANCPNLTEVVFLGATATEGAATTLAIGQQAFDRCTALSNIVLPDYTKTISANAFSNSGIVNLVIPEKVTSIGKAAFYNCKNLLTLEFKNTSALTITAGTASNHATNSGAFANCTALTTVKLSAKIATLSNYTFDGCTSLVSVEIPTEGATLATIGQKVFNNCTSLTTINIPKSVTKIDTSAFACTAAAPGSLTNITFEFGGSGTLQVNNTVFSYQAQLKSIKFPAGTKLSTTATTSISATMTTAGNNIAGVFTGCTSLAKIEFEEREGKDNNFAIVDGVLYNAAKDVVVFCPAANEGAYANGEPTYKLVIPTSVKLVMARAFLDCTKLRTVEFAEFESTDTANYGKQLLKICQTSNNSLTTNAVFGGVATSITEVKLPSHLKEVSGYAFAVTGEVTKETAPMAITFNQDATILINNNAFAKCIAKTLALPNVVQTKGTTAVGKWAFQGTKLLETVSFESFSSLVGPSGSEVQYLPDEMFSGAEALKNVTIPSNIKTIGNSAFYNCKSLQTIEIPSSVVNLGSNAFAHSGLTSITLPTSIVTLAPSYKIDGGTRAATMHSQFLKCESLTSITFKGNLTTISSTAFQECTSLREVNFNSPTSLKTISSKAFFGCSSLSNFDFTKFTALSTIDQNAFSHTALVTVDLSKTTASSLGNGFNNISTLTTFVFPKNASSVGTVAAPSTYGELANGGAPFDNTPALTKITLNNSFKIAMLLFKFQSQTEENYLFEYSMLNCPNINIVIPSTISGTTKDENGVFYSGSKLAWVPPTLELDEFVVPDDVSEIGAFAFAFSRVKSVVVHQYVESIGNYAFYNAAATSITLLDTKDFPSEMYSIGEGAFAYSAITSMKIPDSVEDIGWYALAYCENLTSVTTGASLYMTPTGFIKGSNNVEELKLQEGLVEMDSLTADVFAYDYDLVNPLDYEHKLKSIHIPASVEYLWDGTFYGLNGLETVTFARGSTITDLCPLTFALCSSLLSVELPDTITYIGDAAFYGCTSIKSIDLSAISLAKSQYTDNYIYEYTFAYTTSLETIKLPQNVAAICNRAFYCSGIQTVEIPASVEFFGLGVFENATRLTTVTFEDGSKITDLDGEDAGYYAYEYPEIDDYDNAKLFSGTTALETVTVPNSLKRIGNYTFANSGISKLVMSNPEAASALEEIGDFAFVNCQNLTYFGYVIDEEAELYNNYFKNVKYIGNGAFMNCTGLTKVTFGYELEYLGGMAFAFCTGLERAYIPASVVELGGNPYAGLDMAKFELDPENGIFYLETDANGVIYLKDIYGEFIWAVWGATGEFTMTIGANDPDYAMGALVGNAITKLIVTGANAKAIADYLCMNCTELAEVELASTVKTVGTDAFANTPYAEAQE